MRQHVLRYRTEPIILHAVPITRQLFCSLLLFYFYVAQLCNIKESKRN
jgi:hypothetical protein